MTKSSALSLAKQQYLSNPEYSDDLKHPFFWGGLMIYGLDDPIALGIKQ